ncbi:MAG: hypothetical protein RI964_682 [Pseudomonadota bacterium]|jgi:membrane-bound lytic murein transglycosylase A
MFWKAMLVASAIVVMASTTYAQSPTITDAHACDVQIQGKNINIDENCIRKTPDLRRALVDMSVFLRTTPTSRLAAPEYRGPLDKDKLLRTVDQLLRWLDNTPGSAIPLGQQFDFYALGDPKTKAPVQYGGHYTPTLAASATPTPSYRFPIYAKPAGNTPLPSRHDIMRGALKGKGLEIAWTNDPIGYFFMQVQGSGLIRYPNGSTVLLGFAGKNNYPYTSIGSYMRDKGYLRTENLSTAAIQQWLSVNPDKLEEVLNSSQSFVFFSPMKGNLRAATGLPVVAGHTASVDTSMIPFGSILLAELPLRDNNGKIVQHEWRLLLATDRRAEDKGTVKIGVYTGEGDEARVQAQRLYPSGRAFILLSNR